MVIRCCLGVLVWGGLFVGCGVGRFVVVVVGVLGWGVLVVGM